MTKPRFEAENHDVGTVIQYPWERAVNRLLAVGVRPDVNPSLHDVPIVDPLSGRNTARPPLLFAQCNDCTKISAFVIVAPLSADDIGLVVSPLVALLLNTTAERLLPVAAW